MTENNFADYSGAGAGAGAGAGRLPPLVPSHTNVPSGAGAGAGAGAVGAGLLSPLFPPHTNVPSGAGAGAGAGADADLLPPLVPPNTNVPLPNLSGSKSIINEFDLQTAIQQGWVDKDDTKLVLSDIEKKEADTILEYLKSIVNNKPLNIFNEYNLFSDKLINLLRYANVSTREAKTQIRVDLTRFSLYFKNNNSETERLYPYNYYSKINKLEIPIIYKKILSLFSSQNIGNILVYVLSVETMDLFLSKKSEYMLQNPHIFLCFIKETNNTISYALNFLSPIYDMKISKTGQVNDVRKNESQIILAYEEIKFNFSFHIKDPLNVIDFTMETKPVFFDIKNNKFTNSSFIIIEHKLDRATKHMVDQLMVSNIPFLKIQERGKFPNTIINGKNISSDNIATIKNSFKENQVKDIHPYLAYLFAITSKTQSIWYYAFDKQYNCFKLPEGIKFPKTEYILRLKQMIINYYVLCYEVAQQYFVADPSVFYKLPNIQKIHHILNMFPKFTSNHVNSGEDIIRKNKIWEKCKEAMTWAVPELPPMDRQTMYVICATFLISYEQPVDDLADNFRIVFVRHGTSCANLMKKVSSLSAPMYSDPELTVLGRRSAVRYGQVLKNYLADKGITDLIVGASTLMRTQQTADYMLEPEQIYVIPHIAETKSGPNNTPFEKDKRMLASVCSETTLSKLDYSYCRIGTRNDSECFFKDKADPKKFLTWLAANYKSLLNNDVRNPEKQILFFSHHHFIADLIKQIGEKAPENIENLSAHILNFTIKNNKIISVRYEGELDYYNKIGGTTLPVMNKEAECSLESCRKPVCNKTRKRTCAEALGRSLYAPVNMTGPGPLAGTNNSSLLNESYTAANNRAYRNTLKRSVPRNSRFTRQSGSMSLPTNRTLPGGPVATAGLGLTTPVEIEPAPRTGYNSPVASREAGLARSGVAGNNVMLPTTGSPITAVPEANSYTMNEIIRLTSTAATAPITRNSLSFAGDLGVRLRKKTRKQPRVNS